MGQRGEAIIQKASAPSQKQSPPDKPFEQKTEPPPKSQPTALETNDRPAAKKRPQKEKQSKEKQEDSRQQFPLSFWMTPTKGDTPAASSSQVAFPSQGKSSARGSDDARGGSLAIQPQPSQGQSQTPKQLAIPVAAPALKNADKDQAGAVKRKTVKHDPLVNFLEDDPDDPLLPDSK